jgi:K+-sensing histidine kinase KdpD
MNSSPPSGGAAVISRYGVAVLLGGAAVAISYPFRAHLYTTPFFFAAVFVSCWYGGIGPAILTTIASTAAIHFLLRLPARGFTPDVHDLPRLAEFVFMATVAIYLVQARKRSEQSVRQARDQLEIKVNERTADLQREVIERRRAEQAAQTAAQMAQSHVDMLLHSVDVLAT